jgi:acyl-CoA hydrolase
MDAAGAAFATECCSTPRMLTIKIDECVFVPAKEGQLIKIYGKVAKIGNTSITLYLEARSHNVYSGSQKVILSTKIKFVRVDEQGDPTPIAETIKQRYETEDIQDQKDN